MEVHVKIEIARNERAPRGYFPSDLVKRVARTPACITFDAKYRSLRDGLRPQYG